MIETAMANGSNQVVILLSSSTDSAKNPLECSEKRELLLAGMIATAKSEVTGSEGVEVHVFCPEDLGVSNKLAEIVRAFMRRLYGEDSSPKQLIMMIGEDRMGQFDWIRKSLPYDISFISLPRPEGAMSATKIREFVTSGNMVGFMEKMAPTEVSEPQLTELYEKLGERLKSPARKGKKKAVTEENDSSITTKKTRKTRGGTRRRTRRGGHRHRRR